MKRFGLTGAAGYIAPRHMKAIKETGNELVTAFDPNDSVGIMDSYFPDAEYFTKFELFDAHVDQLRRQQNAIDYISIASPNYLHESHMMFALRSGADAICEKPIVLWPNQFDRLIENERDSGQKVNTILQLRLHPAIVKLREQVQQNPKEGKYDVDLTYITSRGNWYLKSWKAEIAKSGGIATNIGVHFFDMLHFIFGDLQESVVHLAQDTKSAGYLEYEHARVRWYLSLDIDDVPAAVRETGQRTYRSITVDGAEIEFSGGFTDLHNISYAQILDGNGFDLETNRAAIETVSEIRVAQPQNLTGSYHPFAKNQ